MTDKTSSINKLKNSKNLMSIIFKFLPNILHEEFIDYMNFEKDIYYNHFIEEISETEEPHVEKNPINKRKDEKRINSMVNENNNLKINHYFKKK